MTKWVFLALVAVGVTFGCKDTTSPSGPVPSETVGTWNATSMVLRSSSNPTLTFDAIAAGVTFSITLGNDGRFSVTSTVPGEPTTTDAGTVTFAGNQVTITSDDTTEVARTLTWSVANNVMTVSGDLGQTFNFGNGDEPVTTTLTLVKQ